MNVFRIVCDDTNKTVILVVAETMIKAIEKARAESYYAASGNGIISVERMIGYVIA